VVKISQNQGASDDERLPRFITIVGMEVLKRLKLALTARKIFQFL
jgi:hypothetical protein